MAKKTPAKKKKAVGRPSIIVTDEMIATTKDLAKNGIKIEFIVERLRMSVPTFYSKPDLVQAYHDELNASTQEIASALQKKAKEGDTTAQIFWLKSRGRWTTQDYIKMEKFEGDYKQKMQTIDEVFKAGVMNVNNYIGLSRTLTDQFRVDEQETRFRALEEKMGIKRD
jgi:hypothetical protein